MRALLALAALASLPAAPAASLPADTARVGVRVASVVAAAGERVTVPVTVDLTASGKALGSYQGRIRFDPERLRLVEAGTGAFSGPAVVNADRAAEGTVIFAGANPDRSRNMGVTRVLELTFDVTGAPGARIPVSLELQELVSAGDFSNLTPLADVEDGAVVVESRRGRR